MWTLVSFISVYDRKNMTDWILNIVAVAWDYGWQANNA
jgi:hypothetical protein